MVLQEYPPTYLGFHRLTDKSLIVPQINHLNKFIRPQLVPNSLNKEEFVKYVNIIIFPNFALKTLKF